MGERAGKERGGGHTSCQNSYQIGKEKKTGERPGGGKLGVGNGKDEDYL